MKIRKEFLMIATRNSVSNLTKKTNNSHNHHFLSYTDSQMICVNTLSCFTEFNIDSILNAILFPIGILC